MSFLKADGVTPMTVTDTGWLALLAGAHAGPVVSECLKFFAIHGKAELARRATR